MQGRVCRAQGAGRIWLLLRAMHRGANSRRMGAWTPPNHAWTLDRRFSAPLLRLAHSSTPHGQRKPCSACFFAFMSKTSTRMRDIDDKPTCPRAAPCLYTDHLIRAAVFQSTQSADRGIQNAQWEATACRGMTELSKAGVERENCDSSQPLKSHVCKIAPKASPPPAGCWSRSRSYAGQ